MNDKAFLLVSLLVLLLVNPLIAQQLGELDVTLKGVDDNVALSGSLDLSVPTPEHVPMRLSVNCSSRLESPEKIVNILNLDASFTGEEKMTGKAYIEFFSRFESVRGDSNVYVKSKGYVVSENSSFDYSVGLAQRVYKLEKMELDLNLSLVLPGGNVSSDQLSNIEQLSALLSPEFANAMLRKYNITSLKFTTLSFSAKKAENKLYIYVLTSLRVSNLTRFSEDVGDLLSSLMGMQGVAVPTPYWQIPTKEYVKLSVALGRMTERGNLSLTFKMEDKEVTIVLSLHDEEEGPIREYYSALQDYFISMLNEYLTTLELTPSLQQTLNKLLKLRMVPSSFDLDMYFGPQDSLTRIYLKFSNLTLTLPGRRGVESRREVASIIASILKSVERVSKDTVKISVSLENMPSYEVDERLVRELIQIIQEALSHD